MAFWWEEFKELFVAKLLERIKGDLTSNVTEKIASVPGIDVIFAASTDLGNFSGFRQGQPEYEALVTKIHDTVLAHKIFLGGPQAWKGRPERPGFTFFQGPGETNLIQQGARVNLGTAPPAGRGGGVAPVEGQERR